MWLSGFSAGLQTKGSPVWFPVRAHAWVAGQVPSRGHMRGKHAFIFLSLSFSFLSPLCKDKQINNPLKKKRKETKPNSGADPLGSGFKFKKNYTKWKEPVTKDHIVHDSTYRKCPEGAGPGLPAIGGASVATDVHWLKENLDVDGKALRLRCGNGFLNLHVLKITESYMYTSDFMYVNYTSI